MEREWAGRHREGMGFGPPIPPSFSPLRPSSAGHLGVGSLHGRGNGSARGQFLSGALGWRGPRNCKGLSSLPWVQKSVGSGDRRPLVWQLRRGGFGRQDAGLFTVGCPGPSKPPHGMGRLFTQQGEGSQVLCSSLPRMARERGGPGSCRLRLGVQMETSYSRVS